MRRSAGAGLIRGECIVEGCHHKQKLSGKTKSGERRWKPLCETHCRIKYGMPPAKEVFRNWLGSKGFKLTFPNNKCSNCGWDQAHCDRHRLKSGADGGKYVKGNVTSLCPNCHRLAHLKKLNLEPAPDLSKKHFARRRKGGPK